MIQLGKRQRIGIAPGITSCGRLWMASGILLSAWGWGRGHKARIPWTRSDWILQDIPQDDGP